MQNQRPKKDRFQKRLEAIKMKKAWKYFVLGIGIVLGYLFFVKKEPVDLPERPTRKTPKLPPRPANWDWVKKTEADIKKLEDDHDKQASNRENYLDMVNKREKESDKE